MIKISDFIAQLQQALAEHGDIEIMKYDGDWGHVELDGISVSAKDLTADEIHHEEARELASLSIDGYAASVEASVKLWEEPTDELIRVWGTKENFFELLAQSHKCDWDVIEAWRHGEKIAVIK